MTENIEPALTTSEIDAEPAFLALENAWNKVAGNARSRSIFFRHEWFAAAWKWRRVHATLRILTAHRHGNIVGILPLIRSDTAAYRSRQIELLTVPDTQVADLICAPGDAADVADAFAAALRRDRSWDTMFLDALSPEGAALKVFKPALERRGITVAERDGGVNFFVDLSGKWSDYYERRSRSLKKAMNLATNRLRNKGEVQIHCLEPGEAIDEGSFRVCIEEAIQVSARSWKRETGNSLDRPGPQAFIRSMSRAAFDHGWLAIWLLRLDGKPLAMEYDLVFEGNIHALRADFDSACESISPGAYLFRNQLERLFDQGLRRYYMGRGENPYKLRWTEEGDPLRRIYAYNRTPRGLVTQLREESVKPALRKIRDAFSRSRKPAAENVGKKDVGG